MELLIGLGSVAGTSVLYGMMRQPGYRPLDFALLLLPGPLALLVGGTQLVSGQYLGLAFTAVALVILIMTLRLVLSRRRCADNDRAR